MLYVKNKTQRLAHSLFKNPTSEYRGTPFWSWNTKLDQTKILEQIEVFKEMGFGGFHIHVRTGLDTPYLSDEFMDYVKLSNKKAKLENMLCWLYDEDRYPSGAAGGLVTQDLRYRARHLVFSQKQYLDFASSKQEFDQLILKGDKPHGYYLASYSVTLENGYLAKYERVDPKSLPPQGSVWHAYVKLQDESPWYNDQTYVDVLNSSAIERFIEITHERYYEVLGTEFGNSIPAIFTDEPQVSRKSRFTFAEGTKDVTMSFTDDLPETYREAYDLDLLDVLPEIFWELPNGQVSQARYFYHNHLADRFADSFSNTLGTWCEEHNIYLTGHLMSEATLFSQTLAVGEAMRAYRSFHLPGIDILCDAKEFSTAKQAASVAHQYGREGVLSELYGVTQWDHDFKGHKLQGDWQAALGVTVRVPHLAFMSMEGESKRDWPASINYQSPWYQEYHYVEDHFARLNTALTRGRPDIRIGVIHPIESMWLAWGPNDQTGLVREQYDQNFANMISWLLYGLLDFDFISEALLPELCSEGSFPLNVGEMNYNTVLVPDCHTMRSTTLERLQRFKASGGRIIFMGAVPTHVDAVPSDKVLGLAKECTIIPFERASLLQILEPERVVEVRFTNGRLADNLVHQLRADHDNKWLFICHVNRKRNRVDQPERYQIKIKGEYNPSIYDTITGKISSCPAQIVDGQTVIKREMYAEDSLLLHLEPGQPENQAVVELPRVKQVIKLGDPVEYTLEEPNVLLLDRAEYAFDEGEFQPAEEVLRIDNLFRRQLSLPLRMDHYRQPWTFTQPESKEHVLKLRYTIWSDIKVSPIRLAMEQPEQATIYLNGQLVDVVVDGYFTDQGIKTIPLPDLVKGKNELLLEVPFGRTTNIEWCYLLGDFGVRVRGAYTCIESLPSKLAFGDWVNQGLPFYAGNLKYKCPLVLTRDIQNAILEVPHFFAPVIAVALNGQRQGLIAYAPHRLILGGLKAGTHELEFTVYGNRFNAFGTLHNANDEFKWYGPDSYRTTGSQWTDSYLLRPMGILTNPVILAQE